MIETIENSSGITVTRASIREVLETIAFLQSQAGIKLSKVRDNRVYLEKYPSFADYCEAELKEFGGYERAIFFATSTQYTEVAKGGV